MKRKRYKIDGSGAPLAVLVIIMVVSCIAGCFIAAAILKSDLPVWVKILLLK